MIETIKHVTVRFSYGEKLKMVDIVKRYICDACKREVCVDESSNCPSWTVSTEIGDLCPSCSNAWENYKKSFIEKMRKERGEAII